ncbi:hypothetical protein BCD64_01470 [Nostoc sp. MBR 210]|nr:hypothetical protein BCD64_01470 [Nostoc sp. MBR 210]
MLHVFVEASAVSQEVWKQRVRGKTEMELELRPSQSALPEWGFVPMLRFALQGRAAPPAPCPLPWSLFGDFAFVNVRLVAVISPIEPYQYLSLRDI